MSFPLKVAPSLRVI